MSVTNVMCWASLMFDKEPSASPERTKAVHFTHVTGGVAVDVSLSVSPLTKVVSVRLSWQINHIPFNDETLKFLAYESSSRVAKQIVEAAQRVVRLSKNT